MKAGLAVFSRFSGLTYCTLSFTLHLPLHSVSQGVFKYCGLDAFVANYNFLDTMMIFMLYGWSVVPLMYLGSFLFSSSTAAYIKLTLFNYFSTIFSISIYVIRQQYGKDFTKSSLSSRNALNKSGWKSLRIKILIAKHLLSRNLKICAFGNLGMWEIEFEWEKEGEKKWGREREKERDHLSL